MLAAGFLGYMVTVVSIEIVRCAISLLSSKKLNLRIGIDGRNTMATKKSIFDFKNWKYPHERVYSDHGDPIRIVYSGKYDVDGVLIIEEVGKENLEDYIQSFAESVDINNIMARYANGDSEALSKVQGFYFDVTEAPDNMADLLNKLNKAQEGFEKLPAEFKEKYGNDFARFICTFDPEELVETVSSGDIPVIDEDIKEVKNEQE